ncbi:hypothetical protein B0A48_00213 [Cryoendolithus antarcticus]|uniref:Uncharacterized protein n=1 Tax=Cryoendolithus antarcticus TaxID=1507870 RepID=A0A1V8TU32_9PEZI|nr:hypothetical protein B0A48_00213 [Cryoendolithus antarcticus]
MPRPRRHISTPTGSNFPLYNSHRKKPRRWPLALRFIKGAIHADIAIPVLLHSAFAALVTYIDRIREDHIGLPSSIIPSLSIVVGLMLVFRNQTSYDRFWQGNVFMTQIQTSIRNLTRSFLAGSHTTGKKTSDDERADTERTVRVLLAMMYAVKNHLRAEWGATMSNLLFLLPQSTTELSRHRRESTSTQKLEYSELLSAGTTSFEDRGLGLLLQLSVQIEGYIKRGTDREWWHAPVAAQMTGQLNTLVSAYGSLETIHLTGVPVAYLIHLRQVLALFGILLPFALVEEMIWFTLPLTAAVMFTLYGIEAIAEQLEDPFGMDKNDIKVDAIVEDLRVETMVLLEEWRRGRLAGSYR